MTKKIFILVFLITFIVRLTAVSGYNLPFTTDQGRDMIDIRGIAVTHKPRLIGPTTSINGVYLGPFWYYFNLPPFIVSGGDPASLLIWQICWYQLAGLLLYLFLKKFDHFLAFFTAVFFLIMPLGFNTSRYSWNANAMPVFSALFLQSLYLFKKKPTLWRSFIVGLLAGLSFQIEAAFGILFFPFSFLFLVKETRKLKLHLLHLIGFLVTLMPQLFFEFRHQFPLTHVFLSEIGGQSTMLGAKLTLAQRITDRWSALRNLIQQMSHLPFNFLFPVFLLVIAVVLILLIKKRLHPPFADFFTLNTAFLLFALVFYLAFPQGLKSWYLLGLSSALVFLYAVSLAAIFKLGNLPVRFLIVLLVAASFYFSYTAQSEYLHTAQASGSNNKSSLKNEIADLDWIYQKAGGKGFRVYSYLPSIYDYPYQYLFWWYGNQKYGYRPNDVAYLPNQPEYIENRTLFFTNTRKLPENELTFLIIEKDTDNPQFEAAWLGNFAKLCPVVSVTMSYGVEIKELVTCPKK